MIAKSSDSPVFLCGADMNPQAIQSRPELCDSRFLMTGAIPASWAEKTGLPSSPHGVDVWGIVLRVSLDAACGESVTVRLRDGGEAAAALLASPATIGNLAGVLAEARYWELPVSYRDRLEAIVNH